ncbi:hypothetical protein BU14_1594s0001 [Porphyra umbilicalis]|uniref:Phycocyanobilin lyase CpcT n=1 Tax=Porphyra umbilicalis TaxID=2786 RepID=A0A1X6NL70_PORUM|nr:hypothetical protein BU14_1594s0001 [Porphyra umbilicalis]|eukprot:OSX69355.1 hypothetical protein BU14_1594s0001 [Porphyra umbilicalis]
MASCFVASGGHLVSHGRRGGLPVAARRPPRTLVGGCGCRRAAPRLPPPTASASPPTSPSPPAAAASDVAPEATDAVHFGRWIAADWSNKAQALENPPFWAHIHVVFRPLPWSLLDGISFYAESAYDYMLGNPYKTSVVKVVPTPDGRALEFENYKIKEADEFWLGGHEPELLDGLTADRLIKMPACCNTVYTWDPAERVYRAATRPGKECIIVRQGATTYLDSTAVLSAEGYSPWDLGRDPETDERVWGGAAGPFDFVPEKRFADDVPTGPEA